MNVYDLFSVVRSFKDYERMNWTTSSNKLPTCAFLGEAPLLGAIMNSLFWFYLWCSFDPFNSMQSILFGMWMQTYPL